MTYFSHAFKKTFLGTHGDQAETFVGGAGTALVTAGIDNGFVTSSVTTSGGATHLTTADLLNYSMGVGSFAFFDASNYQIVVESDLSSRSCCPLVLASASLMSHDKIGPFHGGYQESTKSKIINPRYVNKFYVVESCLPTPSVVSIGTTPGSVGLGDPACCKSFLCGETYYLRIDLKGSPVLRFMQHNAYRTLDAYTGCCADVEPVAVDPTLVYISWADKIVNDPYLKDFVMPVVFDFEGTPWYAPGTTVSLDGTNTPVTPAQWWTVYAPGAPWVNECTAGMRLYGAFVETKFGNCSFQVTDHYELEPVRIYASLVDYTGDPCTFEGLCVIRECEGFQGQGFGETVLRDLILSESYQQNYVNDQNPRIREITLGDDILNSVNRNALYTRYYIQHSVPRFNNPTGVFDNDQYLLEIITTARSTKFESFMDTWLDKCSDCTQLDEHSCNDCFANIPADVPNP